MTLDPITPKAVADRLTANAGQDFLPVILAINNQLEKATSTLVTIEIDKKFHENAVTAVLQRFRNAGWRIESVGVRSTVSEYKFSPTKESK